MNKHYIIFSDGSIKAFELGDDVEQLKKAKWIRIENEVENDLDLVQKYGNDQIAGYYYQQ